MTRLGYLFRELARGLYRNPTTVLASLLSMALLFLLFDLFWIVAGTSDLFYKNLLSEIEVELFIDDSLPDSTIADLTQQVIDKEGVFSAEYISRETARQRLADQIGTDLLVGYEEENPLPRSLIIKVQQAYLNSSDLALIENELRSTEGISDVSYSRNWLKKAEQTRSVILEVGLVLGLLIFAAVLIGTTNSVRLITRARAIGFKQMLLLGAGRLFIALPFIAEGFLIAGISAMLGWAIVLYGRTRIQLSQIEVVYPTTEEIVLFCFIVAVLGALSGYFGVRKLLKG